MLSSILGVIVVKGHDCVIESRTGLRAVFSAGETGRVPRACMTAFGPGPGVVGRDRSFGDLSVCVDLAFGAVFRVCVGVPEGSSDCVC